MPATIAIESDPVTMRYTAKVPIAASANRVPMCALGISSSTRATAPVTRPIPLNSWRTAFTTPLRIFHIEERPPTIIAPTPMYRI